MVEILDPADVGYLANILGISWYHTSDDGSSQLMAIRHYIVACPERSVQKLELGLLQSVNGSYSVLHPCYHFNVKGECRLVDYEDGVTIPSNGFGYFRFGGQLMSGFNSKRYDDVFEFHTSGQYLDQREHHCVIDGSVTEEYGHLNGHYVYERTLLTPKGEVAQHSITDRSYEWDSSDGIHYSTIIRDNRSGKETKSSLTLSKYLRKGRRHFYVRGWSPPPRPESQIDRLIDDCIDQQKNVDVNSISYLKEFAELGTMAAGTWKAIKGFKNPKCWADIFLSTKYGWKMTLADTLELSEAIGTYVGSIPKNFTKVSSGTSNGEWTESIQFYIDNSATPGNQLRQLMNWGLWPTASNLWDMVPWSFVVNWFTGLQGIIDAIDYNTYRMILPVDRICHTWRFERSVDSSLLLANTTGSLDVKVYDRNILSGLPWSKFKLDTPNGISGHGTEISALVMQKALS